MSKREYEYTGVKLPRSIKKQVRSTAADLETSIGEASLRLIELGLAKYEADPESIRKMARIEDAALADVRGRGGEGA